MGILKEKYTQLKTDSNYKVFEEIHPIIGIWDDNNWYLFSAGSNLEILGVESIQDYSEGFILAKNEDSPCLI